MSWVYEVPTWQFSLLLCTLMVGLACAGHLCVRRYVRRDQLLRHNDVAGFIASLVGVIYAVLLSFVVVVVWQEYDTATSVAQKEASAAGDLYHLSYGFPAPQGSTLRHQLAAYITVILDKEWPAMQRGGTSPLTEEIGRQMLSTVISFKPRDASEVQVRGTAIGDVQTFFDARRDRLSENETSLPGIMWGVLILGAAITIGFTYLFGMESAAFQIIMTAALALVISMMFVLIIELDFPFRGDTRIQPLMWADMAHETARGLPENPYSP